jgi:YHS domain-containing protein
MKHLRLSRMLLGLLAAVVLSSAALADQRLALKGYDPVAYFTESRARLGDAQYRYDWDGATYHFASAKHLDMFKADPDRYLPQYSNLCAASVAKGIKVQGQPEYWLVHEGRLYLFGGPQGPGLMRADTAMKSTADKNYSAVSRLPNPAQ